MKVRSWTRLLEIRAVGGPGERGGDGWCGEGRVGNVPKECL